MHDNVADSNYIDGSFPFEFQLFTDIEGPLIAEYSGIDIRCAIRHSHTSEIVVSGSPGSFNFGLRLFSQAPNKVIFETRAFIEIKTIPKMTWVNISFIIPLNVIEVGIQYLLKFDFVKEHEYWFSKKGGDDVNFFIYFAPKNSDPDIIARLTAIEQELRSFSHEFRAFTANADDNIYEISPLIAEIKAFRAQLPRFTNAISSANAAAAIVGGVRSNLDLESGRIVKALEEFRRETRALWDSLDVLAKRIPLLGFDRDNELT